MTNFFLGASFFFPRLTLFCYWLLAGIPHNTTPWIVDFIGAIFAPRFLIAYWAWEAGFHPLIVVFFVLVGLAEYKGSSVTVSSTKENR